MTTVTSFASIAILAANTTSGASMPSVFVDGFATPGDGGEGTFVFESSTTGLPPVNGGTVVKDAAGQTWVRAPSGATLSVRWFGAKGDGSTDDTNAINNTIAAAVALVTAIPGTLFAGIQIYYTGVKVYFPRGIYHVSSTITTNTAGISFGGDGPSQSIIYRNGDYGDTFLVEPVPATPTNPSLEGNGFFDLGFFAVNAAPTSGAHIHMVACFESMLSNLRVMGHFGGIFIQGCSGMAIDNIIVFSGFFAWTAHVPGSYLMHISASPASDAGFAVTPSEITINNFDIKGGNAGGLANTSWVDNGLIIDCCDLVQFSNGHFSSVADSCCLIQPATATSTVTSVYFNNTSFDGNFVSAFGVAILNGNNGILKEIYFNNCYFSNNEGVGLFGNAGTGAGFSVTGGQAQNNTSTGIDIVSGENWQITGVKVRDNAQTTGTGQVALGGGTLANVSFVGNYVGAITGDSAEPGLVLAGAVSRLNISGNTFFHNTAGGDITGAANFDHASILANNTTDQSSSIASGATVAVPPVGDFFTITGTTGISAFSASCPGRLVTFLFSAALTVTGSSTLLLSGGSFAANANSTLTLRNNGGTGNAAWIEVARKA